MSHAPRYIYLGRSWLNVDTLYAGLGVCLVLANVARQHTPPPLVKE